MDTDRVPVFPLAAASAVPLLYALWIRPRMLTWGATRDETTRAYPDDELVSNPNSGATMATTPSGTIQERVCPGWCRWEATAEAGTAGTGLDNNGEPSVDHIVPEWQRLEEGWHLYRVPKEQIGGTEDRGGRVT